MSAHVIVKFKGQVFARSIIVLSDGRIEISADSRSECSSGDLANCGAETACRTRLPRSDWSRQPGFQQLLTAAFASFGIDVLLAHMGTLLRDLTTLLDAPARNHRGSLIIFRGFDYRKRSPDASGDAVITARPLAERQLPSCQRYDTTGGCPICPSVRLRPNRLLPTLNLWCRGGRH